MKCGYITDTRHENSYGHTDAEVFSVSKTDPASSNKDGVRMVRCTAEARRVIRPAKSSIQLNVPWRTKKTVCEAHGSYLVGASMDERPDFARVWEYDALNPDKIVEVYA